MSKLAMRFGRGWAVAAVAAMGLTLPTARAEANTSYKSLLTEKGPAFVTIKCVLKMGEQERETEITGVMIEEGGLILCSSTQMGASRLLSGLGASSMATPTDIKILIGADEDGVEGKLLARDTELDLAWVQIKEPGDKKYTHVDLSKSKTPAAGDTVLSITKMSKFFDRTAIVAEGHISGVTRKPRELYVPSSGIQDGDAMGLPVFEEDGSIIGIMTIQSPDPEDLEGGPGALRRQAALMILPTEAVAKATLRAKETGGKDEAAAGEEAKKVTPKSKSEKDSPKAGDDSDEE